MTLDELKTVKVGDVLNRKTLPSIPVALINHETRELRFKRSYGTGTENWYEEALRERNPWSIESRVAKFSIGDQVTDILSLVPPEPEYPLTAADLKLGDVVEDDDGDKCVCVGEETTTNGALVFYTPGNFKCQYTVGGDIRFRRI